MATDDTESQAPEKTPGETTAFDLATLRDARESSGETLPLLFVESGTQLGVPFALEQFPLVGGRDPGCDIVLAGRGISRRHFRVEQSGRDHHPTIVDLESTNGVLLKGTRIRKRVLRPGDAIQLGPQTILRFTYETEREIEVRRHNYLESIHDALTGTYNRRNFDAVLDYEIAYSRRHKEALSVILLDIDRFKQINDSFGHEAGDRALCQIADRLAATLRTEDLLARYGGEEFAILLRAQDVTGALETAERLRATLAAERFVLGKRAISITASLGIATLETESDVDALALMRTADRRLYEAKSAGRNQSVGGSDG